MSSAELNELALVLAATPERIQSMLHNLSDEQLRQRTAAGEFSMVESVCHLRDIEAEGYLPRIKRILNEDGPVLPDIDGGRLALERGYNEQDVHEALRAFTRARTESTNALLNLAPDELTREGMLEGVGTVKLQELLVMMREHDSAHLLQMSAIRG